MKQYYERLRESRIDRDLTQEDVARHLGIEQTVFSRYERGINKMSVPMLEKLCTLYNISADYVIFGKKKE